MLQIINKALGKILGNKSDNDVKKLNPYLEKIHEYYELQNNFSNDELRKKTVEFKEKLNISVLDERNKIQKIKEEINNLEEIDFLKKEDAYEQIDKIEEEISKKLEEVLMKILPEAFAVIKQTAHRFKEMSPLTVTANDYDHFLAKDKDYIEISGDTAQWKNKWMAAGNSITWDMVHYDVQLIGGIVLHQGNIAEMQTGEGKTLVATLPLYLNALTGLGVHLVTVNDYLAKRDSEWMAPLFQFHGLSVDCIDKHQPNSEDRRNAYAADITYGTNNEFGFDYLRDNMATTIEDLVQRKHNYTIVDEVDSVLIDDARTPLIISGPMPKGDQQMFIELKPKVEHIVQEQKKLVNTLFIEAKKLIKEGEEENNKEKLTKGNLSLFRIFRGLPKNKALIKYLSEPGIKSQLQKTENFYLQEQGKQMPFVDSELFFIIDEKSNSVTLTDKGVDLITSNSEDKKFFIIPDISTNLATIDKSNKSLEVKSNEKETLMKEYSVKTERIHTIDKLLKAYCMFEKDVEYVIMENKVKIVDEQTGRIMEGRRYSDGLHQAIEAKENVKVEAASQTYATITLQNYFRMYHKLAGMTGTAETEAGEFWEIYKLDVISIPPNKPVAREDKQDLVYKTAREKFNAIINQISTLRELNRPILVGTTSVEISELLSKMLKMRKIPHQVLNAKLHQKEAEIITEAGKPKTVTIATNMAGRGTDIKLTPESKQAGGLAIIGTERHESRRVDRQLRGRSGRQGDVGSSQFFISLEDNLMRLFGSERIAKLMDRLGHKEGDMIQHAMISRSIERAQKKVEENNFGIRKNLLEYDDVMNQQRVVIYKKRKHALYRERLKLDIANSFYDISESIVEKKLMGKSFKSFQLELIESLHIETPFSEQEFNNQSTNSLSDIVYKTAYNHYMKKIENVKKMSFPVIERVYNDENNAFKNIAMPFTDGRKSIQIIASLEKCYETQGEEIIKSLEGSVIMAMIDHHWKEHLREMDDLRQSVQNARFEQKDPLLIYKFESFKLFERIIKNISKESTSFLINANVPQQAENVNIQSRKKARLIENKETVSSSLNSKKKYFDPSVDKIKKQPIISEKKFGRNDKITIINQITGEQKTMKYKQAENLIQGGQWTIS